MFNYNNLLKRISSTCGIEKFLTAIKKDSAELLSILVGENFFTDEEIMLACEVMHLKDGEMEKIFFCTES